MKVLLIEDNAADARLVREMLSETAGEETFHLDVAPTLLQGLTFFGKGTYDVVLLDMSLPDSQGLNTLAAIRTYAPSIPVVLLTGSEDEQLVKEALKRGAQDYLHKKALDASVLSRALQYAHLRSLSGPAVQPSGPHTPARVLGVLGAKGGVGATTLACRLAIELRKLTNSRVALIGLDPASGTLGELMEAKGRYSVVDLGMNLHRLDESFWSSIKCATRFDVDVVQSPGAQSFGTLLSPERVHHVLTFVRTRYDWIVVDAGRFDPLAVGLLSDFHQCVIVSTEDVPTLRVAKRFIESNCTTPENPEMVLTLVLNRLSQAQRWMQKEIQQLVGGIPCFSLLENTGIREAFSTGKLDERGLRPQLRDLAAKIAGMAVEDEPKSRLRLFSRAR